MDDLRNFKKAANSILNNVTVSEDLKKRTMQRCMHSHNKKSVKQIYLTAASLLFLVVTIGGYNLLNISPSPNKAVSQNGDKAGTLIHNSNQEQDKPVAKTPEAKVTKDATPATNVEKSVAIKESTNVVNSQAPINNTPNNNNNSNNSAVVNKPIDNNNKIINQGSSSTITTTILPLSGCDNFPANLKNDINSIIGVRGYKIFDPSSYNMTSDYIYVFVCSGKNPLKEIYTSKIDTSNKSILFIASEALEENDLNNYSIIKIKRTDFKINVFNTKGIEFDIIK